MPKESISGPLGSRHDNHKGLGSINSFKRLLRGWRDITRVLGVKEGILNRGGEGPHGGLPVDVGIKLGKIRATQLTMLIPLGAPPLETEEELIANSVTEVGDKLLDRRVENR